MQEGDVGVVIDELMHNGVKIYLGFNEKVHIKKDGNSIPNDTLEFLKQNRPHVVRYLKKIKQENSFILGKSMGESQPLSYSQRRFWFAEALRSERDPTYTITWSSRLIGAIDLAAMEKAINFLVDRHDIFRTVFTFENQVISQTVSNSKRPTITIIVEEADNFQKHIEGYTKYIFPLEGHPLAKFDLLTNGKDVAIVTISMHHMICDGWSLGVIMKDLSRFYNALQKKQDIELRPLRYNYLDYVASQDKWVKTNAHKNQLDYWLKKLSGPIPILNLPTDYIRSPEKEWTGSSVAKPLLKFSLDRLKKKAVEEGCSLFILLLAAFKIVLCRYASQTDIIVGTQIAGRQDPELHELVGVFLNTLALRSSIDSNEIFRNFLKDIKITVLEAFQNQDIPFDYIVEKSRPERTDGYSPFFRTMLILQNFQNTEISFDGLAYDDVTSKPHGAKADIECICIESNNRLVLHINYATDLFLPETVERFIDSLESVLECVIANPEIRICDIPLLSETEKEKLCVTWNATDQDFSSNSTIHDLFSKQALISPNNLAAISHEAELSYKQLDDLSSKLAAYFISTGVRNDKPIAILQERSLELIVTMLAILKAGGCYVPIDTQSPKARMAYILENSGVDFVVGDLVLLEQYGLSEKFACLATEEITKVGREYKHIDFSATAAPESLCYVLYTSGSTGNPKGVMCTHRGCVNRLEWVQSQYPVGPGSRVLQKTPYTFDVSAWEFFWPLMVGASIVFAKPEGHKDPGYLKEIIDEYAIHTMHFVPSMLAAYLNTVDEGFPETLRQMICSGEELTPEIATSFKQRAPKAMLINLYGPTEASIDVTHHVCDGTEAIVPIGKPIANTKLFILDEFLNSVPVGVPGQLCIGGVGLAKGYIGAKELTERAFINAPEHLGHIGRIYLTGDLAKYREDGSIIYLGRIDNQVKIRGLRIEPGEIEHQLKRIPSIHDVCVVTTKLNTTSEAIVAFIVAEDMGNDVTEEEYVESIKIALKDVLPAYMIPAYIYRIDDIPLLPNGKKNRKALIEEIKHKRARSVERVPLHGNQKKMAAIWASILKLDPETLNQDDNFFKLGGDSLASMYLARQSTEAGLPISIKDIFKGQTLAELCLLAELNKQIKKSTKVLEFYEPELTVAQEWFFSESFNNPNFWNMIRVLDLDKNVSEDVLERAILAVVKKHEALRTVFLKTSDRWKPKIYHEPIEGTYQRVHLGDSTSYSASALNDCINQVQSSLSVSDGPLVRFVLYKSQDTQLPKLIIVAHHLVSDGPSIGIIIDEIQTAYTCLKTGVEFPGADDVVQPSEFVNKMKDFARSDECGRYADYWRKCAWHNISNLPLDYKRVPEANKVHSTRVYSFTIGSEQTRKFIERIQNHLDSGVWELLVSSLSYGVACWSGRQDVQIISIDSGRSVFSEEHGLDLTNTVGWLSYSSPIFLHHTNLEDVQAHYVDASRQLREIYQRGATYDLLYWYRGEDIPPLIDDDKIVLNYLGRLDAGDLNGELYRGFTDGVDVLNQDQKNDRSCLFMCIAYLLDNEIHYSIQYSDTLHTSATVASIGESMKAYIGNLINNYI